MKIRLTQPQVELELGQSLAIIFLHCMNDICSIVSTLIGVCHSTNKWSIIFDYDFDIVGQCAVPHTITVLSYYTKDCQI